MQKTISRSVFRTLEKSNNNKNIMPSKKDNLIKNHVFTFAFTFFSQGKMERIMIYARNFAI